MLTTPALNHYSPHEMLYKIASDFNGLKVFGSLCYASTSSTSRRKFDQMTSFLLVLKENKKICYVEYSIHINFRV